MLQKNVLFSGTIKENLRWGDENASDEELERVCRLAQADEFIQQMPDQVRHPHRAGRHAMFPADRSSVCASRARC